ncbi:MAG: helix-turn-helix transcriptional regulator [Caldilineaceae bacterium]
MRNKKEFADIVGQYLAQQERSQAWLAQRLGVERSTVTRWLNHGNLPNSPETVILIADILGIQDAEERAALLDSAGYVVHSNNQGDQPVADDTVISSKVEPIKAPTADEDDPKPHGSRGGLDSLPLSKFSAR